VHTFAFEEMVMLLAKIHLGIFETAENLDISSFALTISSDE